MRLARKDAFEPTPICRCRVLYLGSAVPQVTKDGLQGIQEPLRELYPAEGAVSAKGIDSWLSVWSNGLLLENVDENQKKVTRFFPIESLHYCAAVRYVVVSSGDEPPVPRFLPLDSPFARNPSISHPPLFACILRRTTGIKVLECHAFICKRETPANALVRCCFHAYADSMYAKSLEGSTSRDGSLYGGRATEEIAIEVDYTGDLSSANSEILPGSVRSSPTNEGPSTSPKRDDELSIYNGDENHKVWAGPPKSETEIIYSDYGTSTLRSARSTSSLYGTAGPSKSNRPRQMIMPSVAPPPPIIDSEKEDKRGKKESKFKGKLEDDTTRMANGRPSSVLNGRRVPVNGSLPRPINGIHPSHPLNGTLIRSGDGYAVGQKSKGKIPRMFSSLSERKNKGKRPPPPFIMVPHGAPMPVGPPIGAPQHSPSNMMYPPNVHLPHPHMIPGPHGGPMPPQMAGPHVMMSPYGPLPPPYGRRPGSRAAEEPIYMPSSRPMSPTASYQPGHFPHEQYLLQQYASTGRPKHKKKKKRKGKDIGDEDIYGRKGHLNERAFSHSIREEHRSQSFASLVGLDDSQLSKKDKEMMQMVADLDLSGDEIERVEVRPGVYRPPRSDISGTINSRVSRR